MFVDDFVDEFYAFDINNWAYSLEKILLMLNFPVQIEYTCGWKEFLYEKSDKLRYFGTSDRKVLAECQEITLIKFSGRFRRIKFISVLLTGNHKLRNEKVYEIYKLFRKVYGKYIIFVACFDRDIAFVGTYVDKWKKSEVIISDWFGENTDYDMMSRIMEIDFSLFSFDSIGKLYNDYLWAIARPYVKYRESKIYLMFGCGHIETYESFVSDPEGNNFIPVTKIDKEDTFRINSAYYPEIYGDDYFIDESAMEDDTLDIIDEDDSEFEWTMLEMELAEEDFREDDEFDEQEDEYDSEDADYTDISGMNPEEMLKYIRKK